MPALQSSAFLIVSVALLGCLVCVVWWMHIHSLRKLNEAKFRVINALEDHLPAAPFCNENAYLHMLRSRNKRFSLSSIQQLVPMLFAAAVIVLALSLSLLKQV